MDYFQRRRLSFEEKMNAIILERNRMLDKALEHKDNLEKMMESKQKAFDEMTYRMELMRRELER